MSRMLATQMKSDESSVSIDARSVGPILSIEAITKSFSGQIALHSTNLSIGSGEFVTLLGPSGCGKTTLLRIIAGLETPSGGRLVVGGRDVTHMRPEHRPFNMVFQSYALFPHLDVFDNVAYGLRAVGLDERAIAAKVNSALELVGLGGYRERGVSELSGGMSQRVALVRAIVNEPRILLLDEPLAALDLQLRKRMQIELRAIQRSLGTTFVLVTHDQEEALVMSDRVVVMNAGRICQIGRPTDVYRRPVSRFVAGFVGETSLIPCSIKYYVDGAVGVEFSNGVRAEFARYDETSPSDIGSAGFISLRPEELQIVPREGALFKGVVVSSVFTGPATRVTILVEPALDLKVTTQDSGVGQGDQVGVRIVPGGGVFVPDV